ncbi:MAG TPA: hypothetical protein VNZ45_03035 [Bacteroidia bacterium]|jgi:hypothetical protein|nr:hypothetical protein [Bacteroidia bacterium]
MTLPNNLSLPKFATENLVTLAQLQDLQSAANLHGDTRQGGSGLGKQAGKRVMVDMGAQTSVLDGNSLNFHAMIEAIALGKGPSAPWMSLASATTLIAPVNIKDPDNTQSTWTLTNSDATYSNGLLTVSTVHTLQCTQNVTLKAGTYYLNGSANTGAATYTPQVIVTGATDGIVLTYNPIQPVSVGDVVQYPIDQSLATFTLTAPSQTVTFTNNLCLVSNGVVTGGTGETGSAHIRYILESTGPAVYPVTGQQ